MAVRDKNIFSILQRELNPSDSDDDDDDSAASSEDEYVPSDESDSEEEHNILKRTFILWKKILNQKMKNC